MSHPMDGLPGTLDSVRQLDGAWDGERAARIRSLALRTHSGRVRRARVLGRILVGGTSAACLVLALLRVAASAPSAAVSASASGSTSASSAAGASELVASRALDDAGYTTD